MRSCPQKRERLLWTTLQRGRFVVRQGGGPHRRGRDLDGSARRARFPHGRSEPLPGLSDTQWFGQDGQPITPEAWRDPVAKTFGMLRALQDAGVAGKVKFVGFDASPKLIDALKSGQIDGLIVQDPRKMGYLGVKTVVDKINGKPIEAKVDTGVTFVTKAGLDTPTIAALIAPPKN